MTYEALYSNLVYPLYHWALRDGANAAIKDLDHNETLPPEVLDIVVKEKRNKLLLFAGRHVPYYRDLFGKLNLRGCEAFEEEEFRRIPFLTKAQINAHRKELISENLQNNGLDEDNTGGSTGEVVRFYTDWRSGAYRKATVRRNKRWAGIQPGAREVRLWGAPLDIAKANSWRGSIHAAVTRERWLTAEALDRQTLEGYLKYCQSFRPKLMVAYPSALLEFARFCSEYGQRVDSLHAVICSAETLFDHDRHEIEQTLDVRIFNRYGCREVGDIAQEAQGVDGLLVNSDRIFVEILDEEGNPCGPGEQGEVVITDLDNYGMPLIRYRVGDYARWANANARGTSGYPFPVLESVDGRTLDVVKCPSGKRVGGTFWTRTLLRSRYGLKRIQVIQDEPSTVRVLYQREADCIPDFDFFNHEIEKKCGSGLNVKFVETDDFEYTATTKFRLIICRL